MYVEITTLILSVCVLPVKLDRWRTLFIDKDESLNIAHSTVFSLMQYTNISL